MTRWSAVWELRYSYAQLHMAARQQLAARFAVAKRLVKGRRVGIWSHNNAEWVLMQLATAARIGTGAGQYQPGLPHS